VVARGAERHRLSSNCDSEGEPHWRSQIRHFCISDLKCRNVGFTISNDFFTCLSSDLPPEASFGFPVMRLCRAAEPAGLRVAAALLPVRKDLEHLPFPRLPAPA
jgi:hypothetical protein